MKVCHHSKPAGGLCEYALLYKTKYVFQVLFYRCKVFRWKFLDPPKGTSHMPCNRGQIKHLCKDREFVTSYEFNGIHVHVYQRIHKRHKPLNKNTSKQLKTLDLWPCAFNCFSVFGTRDEALTLIFYITITSFLEAFRQLNQGIHQNSSVGPRKSERKQGIKHLGNKILSVLRITKKWYKRSVQLN